MRRFIAVLVCALPALLAGCDFLGIESAVVVAARREAEGKAVGAGCRHAARSVEQCYELNKRADKAAVFAGWKEMNDYMRENNIQAQPAVEPAPAADAADGANAEARPAAKADGKGAGKTGAKAARAEDAKH